MAIHYVAFNQSALNYSDQNFTSAHSVSTLYKLSDEYNISKFALSVNPIGFVQFGPIINVEFGIVKNLVLNTHVRFTPLGLLSYVVRSDSDGLDKLSGIAYGGGIYYFFGEKRSKPYTGITVEYDKSDALYAKDSQWEWSEIDKTVVLAANGGYRFRFLSGFFINTGANFGVALVKWNWEYSDSTYGNGGTGNEVKPFGMLEVTFGKEF